MSSKRNVRRHECGRKKQYATKQEAVGFCGMMKSKDGREWWAYRCRFGNHWHAGHSDNHLSEPHAAKRVYHKNRKPRRR